MDKKINNFLKAYGAKSDIDKKGIIEKLLAHLNTNADDSKEELIRLVNNLSKKLKSEEDDLAIIRKIIEAID